MTKNSIVSINSGDDNNFGEKLLNFHEIEEEEEIKDTNITDNEEAPSPGDKNKNIVVATLCLVNLVANSAYSSIAPFFPGKAEEKNV